MYTSLLYVYILQTGNQNNMITVIYKFPFHNDLTVSVWLFLMELAVLPELDNFLLSNVTYHCH